VLVAYLLGLAMRRIADLHAGEAKTDARDAYIIAEAARSLPHTLRSLKLADNQIADLTMLCGCDEDLAGQITQASNRIVDTDPSGFGASAGFRVWITPPCSICSSVVRRRRNSHRSARSNWPTDSSNSSRAWGRVGLRRSSKRSRTRRSTSLATSSGWMRRAANCCARSEQTVVVLGTQAACIVLPCRGATTAINSMESDSTNIWSLRWRFMKSAATRSKGDDQAPASG
jgi:Transposase